MISFLKFLANSVFSSVYNLLWHWSLKISAVTTATDALRQLKTHYFNGGKALGTLGNVINSGKHSLRSGGILNYSLTLGALHPVSSLHHHGDTVTPGYSRLPSPPRETSTRVRGKLKLHYSAFAPTTLDVRAPDWSWQGRKREPRFLVSVAVCLRPRGII